MAAPMAESHKVYIEQNWRTKSVKQLMAGTGLSENAVRGRVNAHKAAVKAFEEAVKKAEAAEPQMLPKKKVDPTKISVSDERLAFALDSLCGVTARPKSARTNETPERRKDTKNVKRKRVKKDD